MYQTQIQKWGNSQAIRIPKAMLELVSISSDDAVDLSVDGDKIILSKARGKRLSLADRFAGYDGNYRCEEWDTGADKGVEQIDV